MQIKRSGAQPSQKGPEAWFTGTVRIDPLHTAPESARAGMAAHWGGPIEEIRPGDVVWFEPGEKHWHGASPNAAMTHIATQESLN